MTPQPGLSAGCLQIERLIPHVDRTGEVRVVVVGNSEVPHLVLQPRNQLSNQSAEWQRTLVREHRVLKAYCKGSFTPKTGNRSQACKTRQLCLPHEPSFICPAARTKPD